MTNEASSFSVSAASRRHRLSVALISFFHFAALGSLLPILPLYLRRTIGLTWTHTGLVMSTMALGLITSGFVVAIGRRLYLDSRLGLALSHLISGGIVMGIAWSRQNVELQIVHLWQIAAVVAVYGVALLPSLRWMNQIGAEQARDADPGGNSWRLWGAVGFVAPSWLCEFGLIRYPEIQPAIESHDLLLLVTGWSSIVASLCSLLSPSRTRANGAADLSIPGSTEQRPPTRMPIVALLAFVLMILMQRSHSLWTAPYFADVTARHAVQQPFLHRLIVVSQVVETLGLFVLVLSLRILRYRITMLIGTAAWIVRAVLLAWLAQADLSIPNALSGLFVAQVLYGTGLVGFFGALGAMLHGDEDQCPRATTALLTGIATAIAFGVSGAVAGQFLSGTTTGTLQRFLQFLPESVDVAGTSLSFSGWTGIWLLGALPGLLALPLVLLARPPKLSA